MLGFVRVAGWLIFAAGIALFAVGGGFSQERTSLATVGIGVTILGMVITSISNFLRVLARTRRMGQKNDKNDATPQ